MGFPFFSIEDMYGGSHLCSTDSRRWDFIATNRVRRQHLHPLQARVPATRTGNSHGRQDAAGHQGSRSPSWKSSAMYSGFLTLRFPEPSGTQDGIRSPQRASPGWRALSVSPKVAGWCKKPL
jgi:hypothetical protein